MSRSLLRPAGGLALRSLLAVCLSVAGCASDDVDSAPSAPWSATVLAVDGPPDGLLRCAPDGARCAKIAAGEELSSEALVRTARGARTTLDLGSGATLALSDDASALLSADGGRLIRVDRGSATVSTAAPEGEGEEAQPPLRVAVLDHLIDMDPTGSTSLAILATAADRASITVHRGQVAIADESREPVTLRSGDSVRLLLGEAVTPRDAWSADAAPTPRTAPPTREVTEAELPRSAPPPRGLGSVTARVPGTNRIVTGVRVASHKVSVVVRDGYARTEVEEVLQNDSPQVLEGRYAFPLPAGASVSRLALWVGRDLVEGEVVERARAARIFKGIVDDTVRPRDPALLEWVSGSEVALKIFPIPARGSRKVVLAYNEVLPAAGGRVRYVYPLSLGLDRQASIDDFAFTLQATDAAGALREVRTPGYPATIGGDDRAITVGFSAASFRPNEDVVVTYQRQAKEGAELSTYAPTEGELGSAKEPSLGEKTSYAALRMTASLPDDVAIPERVRRDRVIAIDASASQSEETLAAEIDLALGLVRRMDPDERFAVLACDSACVSYPEDGLANVNEAAVREAEKWLREKAPQGSTDLGGALIESARRLDRSGAGQVVLVGDGSASAGELSASAIAARARSVLPRGLDLRLLGAGRTVDEMTLTGIAAALGGAYERVATGGSMEERIDAIALRMRRPVVEGAHFILPEGFGEVLPRALGNVAIGQEVVVTGRIDPRFSGGTVTLAGTLDGKPFARTMTIERPSGALSQNPLVPRLFAEAKIAELLQTGDEASAAASIALSTQFHVMSRLTSLLVLENDRMFAEFGVTRTARRAEEQSDHAFAGQGDAIDDARAFGMIGGIQGNAPWGAESDGDAKGNLWGDRLEESFGAGGLGLSGVGEGGGGRGEGLGLGSVGTIGHGASGFGSGSGRLSGEHRSSAPRVRMGATQVSGRLPPEVIQRIVRQQFGRMRNCYEQGLFRKPDLAGRVSVRFLIGSDGRVASAQNSGSDLPDAETIACVVNAFRNMSFPEPPDGLVTVVYPIVFTSDGTQPKAPPSPWAADPLRAPSPGWVGRAMPSGPSAISHQGSEAWRTAASTALDKLREGVRASETSRSKHEALIRGLLVRGRFEEALEASRRLVALDPDLPAARELLAYALATNGDREGAVTAIDALVEAAPASLAAHGRAARAYEATGDSRRACAHLRSIAELSRGKAADAARREALLCRATGLGERDAVIAELRAQPASSDGSPLVAEFLENLESGKTIEPGVAAKNPGQLEAKVTCAEGVERCPTAIVIGPDGTVIAPFLPTSARSSDGAVALPWVRSGTYRTLLIGGQDDARGDVRMRALASVRSFSFERGGLQTIASTTVSSL